VCQLQQFSSVASCQLVVCALQTSTYTINIFTERQKSRYKFDALVQDMDDEIGLEEMGFQLAFKATSGRLKFSIEKVRNAISVIDEHASSASKSHRRKL